MSGNLIHRVIGPSKTLSVSLARLQFNIFERQPFLNYLYEKKYLRRGQKSKCLFSTSFKTTNGVFYNTLK